MRSDFACFPFLLTSAGNVRWAGLSPAPAYQHFFVTVDIAYLTGLKKAPETINLSVTLSKASLSNETNIDTNFFIHFKNRKPH